MKSGSYPSVVETINGAIVHWPRIAVLPNSNSPHKQVPFICRFCGKEQLIKAAVLMSRRQSFTGACLNCAGKAKSERVTEKYQQRGLRILANGAKVYWNTATPPAKGTSNYTVEVECNCGRKRAVRVPALLHRNTSGRCQSCSAKFQNNSLNNPRRKGRSITGDGYRMIRIQNTHPHYAMAVRHSRNKSQSQWGAILEHRLIAAMTLGRNLERWEYVHHIDGDKLNNTPENLQVIAPEQHATITAMQREINRLRQQVAQLEKIISDSQAQ